MLFAIKHNNQIKHLNEGNTFKLSISRYAEYANLINDKNVLLIDDTISRGQTIKETCSIIKYSYKPKSVSVLTLISPLDNVFK